MLRAGDKRDSGLSVPRPRPGDLRVSRRSVLAGGVGTAAMIASPDLFSAVREPAAAAASVGSAGRTFFLYGVTGAADPGGAAVTITLVDMLSGTAESGGTLELPDLPPATSLLVTPVLAADCATVALVL